MPIQVEGRAAGEKAGFFWRGVTESGALDSSLSFLNRLSVGKAMANAQPGVKLQTQRLHRATTRLLQRVATWILPKAPCTGKAYEWTTVTHSGQLITTWNVWDAYSYSRVSPSYYPSVCGIIWVIIYDPIESFKVLGASSHTPELTIVSSWSKKQQHTHNHMVWTHFLGWFIQVFCSIS